MKTMRWCMAAVSGICVLFAACENPWVKRRTDILYGVSISTPAELAKIANNLRGNYKLTADIYLPEVPEGLNNWTPIGSRNNPFTGTFDGNGYTISGLAISATTDFYQGLFSNISGSGTVKNLGLTDVIITSSTSLAGGIAGSNYGTIRNCYVTGTITGADSVGGIAGDNSGGIIENCYTTADITATNGAAGGITGRSAGIVRNCYATGSINGGSGTAGGLAGNCDSGGTVSNSVALNPSITGSGSNGRIAGTDPTIISKGTFTNNKARADMKINNSQLPSGSGTASNKDGADVVFNPNNPVSLVNVFSGWNTSIWNIPSGNLVVGGELPTLKIFPDKQNPTLP